MGSGLRNIGEILDSLEDSRWNDLKTGVGFLVIGLVGVFMLFFGDYRSVIDVEQTYWMIGLVLAVFGFGGGFYGVYRFCRYDGYPDKLSLSDRVHVCLYSLGLDVGKYLKYRDGRKRYKRSVRKWLRRLNSLVEDWGIGAMGWMRDRLDLHTEGLKSLMEVVREFSERMNYFVKNDKEFPEDFENWAGSNFYASGEFMEEGLGICSKALAEMDEGRDDVFTMRGRVRKAVISVVRVKEIPVEGVSSFQYFLLFIISEVVLVSAGYLSGLDVETIRQYALIMFLGFVVPYLVHLLRVRHD